MAGMLRALVVDDHEMFSEALALLFGREPGIELVAVLPAGEEAVARCRVEAPDVVLMDVGTLQVSTASRPPGGSARPPRVRGWWS
jgi:DNA-binding NarL/FixJ family response regulator